MFLDRRVYQGSCGKVYPLPFTDRISTQRTDRTWRAIYLENKYLTVMILPEIGGRIHAILDKSSGYDAIYRQEVIKPALVGLAGPWISGGIEFNWPQHHRPTTFMPVDVAIQRDDDGSVTVWMSEHEPMNRMKGMHGVCLHPGKAFVEVKVRLYNRTELTQTFLWWANAATKVHELYQSFFPRDVQFVADHAKRAMSRFPLCDRAYYGVEYGRLSTTGDVSGRGTLRFPPQVDRYALNDLSWYANIPVPTSYMCAGSQFDFFGGYDHGRQCGIVQIANHHISPGKKQWTWGNHPFGYAWDRNLSDDGAPYIELMAGVYTDNQPDFSFLAPGETRTFSQYWYPISQIGPADFANLDAAISLKLVDRSVRLGIAVTMPITNARLTLTAGEARILDRPIDLAPDHPFVGGVNVPPSMKESDFELIITADDGRVIAKFRPVESSHAEPPPPATEPPPPADVESNDELFMIAAHLEQYRHATRSPEPYWREALRRDPLDSRCNTKLGIWHLRRGEFELAARHLALAIQRMTSRNPNPADGEAHYHLGLTLRHLGRDDQAYAALYKATWNYAWQSPAFLALAELDCRRQNWTAALEHLDRSLAVNTPQLRARSLKVVVLRKLGRLDEATTHLRASLEIDRLDFLARYLVGEALACDTHLRLDLALDCARAGFYDDAINVLKDARPEPTSGTAPLVHYCKGYFLLKAGQREGALSEFELAQQASGDYCFPSRLDEVAILKTAISIRSDDAPANYYLGNLLYDRHRREEAIAHWERAVELNPEMAIAWRNLGIGYFNVRHDPGAARDAFERALQSAPDDARILFERDQLWKRIGISPRQRLTELEQRPELVAQRDDLSVEICDLFNLLGQHEDALTIVSSRQFQPWEGGEGQALAQHVSTHLALGREALNRRDFPAAREHFDAADSSPPNLGEARHLLSNQAQVQYHLGLLAEAQQQQESEARHHFAAAAAFDRDFQAMSVTPFSEMTCYSALALRKLGKKQAANRRLSDLLRYAKKLRRTPAKIDYFATSLPAMLLFEDDLHRRQETTAMFLEAQALAGLGKVRRALSAARQVARRDPSHAMCVELIAKLSSLHRPSRTKSPQIKVSRRASTNEQAIHEKRAHRSSAGGKSGRRRRAARRRPLTGG
jgi:tetratricopeptide (TPR) repeat protein